MMKADFLNQLLHFTTTRVGTEGGFCEGQNGLQYWSLLIMTYNALNSVIVDACECMQFLKLRSCRQVHITMKGQD